ncbi:MAG: peptidase M20 [Gammaproteobacteria bacterium CG_4_10_14_0_8_um_filter_38_16]|nr:MAG: peptidase M20 [Gammaproteobacteria bacterium CG_4_10_14_0_8_um_filter_38_16]PJA04372.1 MAG: peptidase M20 [Gammaproteobacteria bacterium CG_4_10_14_0_2_um_filter_38_22]
MSDIQQKIKNNFSKISEQWDNDIIPQLEDYIRIPCQSPMFDKNWQANGHMMKAMQLLKNWCEKQNIKQQTIELIEIENRTPVMLIDIPGDADKTILLYGHMDKQPEMVGWDDGLGAWNPVIKEGKLYGRGGADDGYAVFSALNAIAYLQSLDIPHAHCVVLIEASEESGSCDLPPYLKLLEQKIGEPDLVICLDSESGNYDQLWGTTSLRGLIGGDLHIDTLRNGIHSGYGSGVAPSVFHILRQLLDRIEDSNNGKIQIDDLFVTIPESRLKQIKETAAALGNDFIQGIPFLEGVQPLCHDTAELILNRTWRPALSIVGIDGAPATSNAGNVTLPNLSVKLSLRVPPTCDAKKASAALKTILENDPPFGAKVSYEVEKDARGWNSPELAPWLSNASDQASQLFFGKNTAYLGIGGTIPFMGMLNEKFPKAQFLITGVLGPQSNAHGPNEFLHIDYVKKLTGCVASVIAAHFEKDSRDYV